MGIRCEWEGRGIAAMGLVDSDGVVVVCGWGVFFGETRRCMCRLGAQERELYMCIYIFIYTA